MVLVVKNLPANAGDATDMGSISGLGRSPGEGNDNPLQYSCLENPRDREASQSRVHGATRIRHLATKPKPGYLRRDPGRESFSFVLKGWIR